MFKHTFENYINHEFEDEKRLAIIGLELYNLDIITNDSQTISNHPIEECELLWKIYYSG